MKTLDNRFGTKKMATTQVIDRIPLSCDIRLRSEILHYKENLVLTFFFKSKLIDWAINATCEIWRNQITEEVLRDCQTKSRTQFNIVTVGYFMMGQGEGLIIIIHTLRGSYYYRYLLFRTHWMTVPTSFFMYLLKKVLSHMGHR